MVAVGFLKIERAAYDESIKRNIKIALDYEPISHPDLAKIKTTLWVTVGFADYAAPDVMTKVFLNADSAWPIGSCAALAETAQAVVLTSAFLDQKYPFEVDMSRQSITLEKVFEASKSHCRLTYHRSLLQHPEVYVTDTLSFYKGSIWDQIQEMSYLYGRHIPLVRQTIGLQIMTVARPNFTMLYEKEE